MTRSFFSNEEYTRVAMTIIQEYPFLKDGKSDSPIVSIRVFFLHLSIDYQF